MPMKLILQVTWMKIQPDKGLNIWVGYLFSSIFSATDFYTFLEIYMTGLFLIVRIKRN